MSLLHDDTLRLTPVDDGMHLPLVLWLLLALQGPRGGRLAEGVRPLRFKVADVRRPVPAPIVPFAKGRAELDGVNLVPTFALIKTGSKGCIIVAGIVDPTPHDHQYVSAVELAAQYGVFI